MKKKINSLCRCFSDLILIIGAATLSLGIGMIYVPAGVIAGGILLIIGGALEGLSGGDSS